MAALKRTLVVVSAAAALALGAFGAAPASAQEPPPPECPNVPTCVNWAFDTARWAEDTAHQAAGAAIDTAEAAANETIREAVRLLNEVVCTDSCLPDVREQWCRAMWIVFGTEDCDEHPPPVRQRTT